MLSSFFENMAYSKSRCSIIRAQSILCCYIGLIHFMFLNLLDYKEVGHIVIVKMTSTFLHLYFYIRIFASIFLHPHFCIYIFTSAFLHPYYDIRIFTSAFLHPYYDIRILAFTFLHPKFYIHIFTSKF
jgi:hypothetical protein